MNFGEDSSSSSYETQPNSKNVQHYNRLSSHQLEQLEAAYQREGHPSGKTQKHLAKSLGVKPSKVKFWFQNRRTKSKNNLNKSDNGILKAQNTILRAENEELRAAAALRVKSCPSCAPGVRQDNNAAAAERELNGQLQHKLNALVSDLEKNGVPLAQLLPLQPVDVSYSASSCQVHINASESILLTTGCPNGVPGHQGGTNAYVYGTPSAGVPIAPPAYQGQTFAYESLRSHRVDYNGTSAYHRFPPWDLPNGTSGHQGADTYHTADRDNSYP